MQERGGQESPTRTILVLPVEFVGQDEGSDRAGRAFAEAMAINLAQAKGLTVLPVPKALESGRGGRGDPSSLAKRVGADLVLTGSVLRDGKSLRATFTAIDSKRNRVLCGAQETADDGDLSRIAATTIRELVSQLGISQPKRYDYFRYISCGPELAKFPGLPETIAALRRHDVPAGLAGTQRLIEAFPNDYDAHAMRMVALIDAFNFDNSQSNGEAVRDEANVLARIDPKSPFAGYNPLERRDPEEQLIGSNRSLLRDDFTPAARSHGLRERAKILQSMDSTGAALTAMEEAIRFDPASPFNYTYLADILHRIGRKDEAIDRLRQAIALDPWFVSSYTSLGKMLEDEGNWDEALRNYRTARDINQTQAGWSWYALALWRAGYRDSAAVVANVGMTRPETAEGSYGLACIKAQTGSRREALSLLHRSLSLGFVPTEITNDQYLAPLRGDPEFERIVRDVQLQSRATQPR
jgi:tetratricopeptide (TPR) repeat protein